MTPELFILSSTKVFVWSLGRVGVPGRWGTFDSLSQQDFCKSSITGVNRDSVLPRRVYQNEIHL